MNISNGNLTIRNATTTDAALLCVWWNDGAIMAHAGHPGGLGTTPEKISADIAADTDETRRRHIIELDGKPIGEMIYFNKGAAVAEIGIKICDPSKLEKGLGTKLLAMFIYELFAMGYRKIVLDTSPENKRAQHVYEKLGFKQSHQTPSAIFYELTPTFQSIK